LGSISEPPCDQSIQIDATASTICRARKPGISITSHNLSTMMNRYAFISTKGGFLVWCDPVSQAPCCSAGTTWRRSRVGRRQLPPIAVGHSAILSRDATHASRLSCICQFTGRHTHSLDGCQDGRSAAPAPVIGDGFAEQSGVQLPMGASRGRGVSILGTWLAGKRFGMVRAASRGMEGVPNGKCGGRVDEQAMTPCVRLRWRRASCMLHCQSAVSLSRPRPLECVPTTLRSLANNLAVLRSHKPDDE
jgi:hypothetical protein